MHPFKQLLRQPLRTAAALIILTASAAFICLSWGVYRSGLATAKAVDEGFTTLMVYDTEYLNNNKTTVEMNVTDGTTGESIPTEIEVPLLIGLEDDGTFDSISAALPQSDALRDIMISRYANAYIDGYSPIIPSLDGSDSSNLDYYDTPYNSAVLVFKAADVKIEPHIRMEGFYRFSLEGDIIARPAFSDRYAKIDKIRLTCNSTDEKELEDIKSGYEAGKTYIVSLPEKYCDIDRRAKQEIINMYLNFSGGASTGANVDNVDWSKLEIGSDKTITSWMVGETVDATIEYGGQVIGISAKYLDGLGYCGSKPDAFFFPRKDIDSDYCDKIAEVPGTLEDFLADPANQYWVDTIKEINTTVHNVTVYGTDNINSLILFADKTMYLSDGEEFSAEDYEKGNNVCIVSETAAYKNGWKLGDKIPINYYPTLGSYSTYRELGMLDEYKILSDEYVIKGIYRHTNQFPDKPDNISANTIFVPNKCLYSLGIRQSIDENSDDGSALSEESILSWSDIKSMVVKNGRIDDMKAFIEQQGWDLNWFKFYDGGYSEVKSTVEGIKDSADDQLLASTLTCLAAFIIYIALFVMRQRKNVGVMLSLGSGKKRAVGFMAAISTIPAAVATVLGAIIGCAMLKGSVARVVAEASHQLDTSFSGASATGHAALENTAVLPSAAIIAAIALLAVYIAAFVIVSLITAGKNPRSLIRK